MPVLLLFDVSGGELIVVMLFVLLFFGSKGLPDVARTMGRTLRQLRDATADVQREIEKGAAEVKQGFEQQRKAFQIGPPEQSKPVQPHASEPAVADSGATPAAPEGEVPVQGMPPAATP